MPSVFAIPEARGEGVFEIPTAKAKTLPKTGRLIDRQKLLPPPGDVLPVEPEVIDASVESLPTTGHVKVDHLSERLDTCVICALPRKTRLDVERALYSSLANKGDCAELAKKFKLSSWDIERHTERCIINREVGLPVNQIIRTALAETKDFMDILQDYKQDLATNMNSETMGTYGNLFREVRLAMQDFQGVVTPQAQAQEIISLVMSPFILKLLQDLIGDCQCSRDVLVPITAESNVGTVRKAFDDLVSKLGVTCREHLQTAKEKLAELLDINISDLE